MGPWVMINEDWYKMDNDPEIELISEQRWINHILLSLIVVEAVVLMASLIWL